MRFISVHLSYHELLWCFLIIGDAIFLKISSADTYTSHCGIVEGGPKGWGSEGDI